MRRVALQTALFAFLLGSQASAAVVQGVVLDEETGYALARAQLSLTPLQSGGAAPVAVRSSERGAFSILNVRPGWYVLRATRRGYAMTEAGQMRAGRPGTPFQVTSDDRSSFFQIRMTRLAALAGAVLDENNIGIADWPVHIYTARKPVRRIAETTTDDRGNFRIGGLDPGVFIARSGAGALEDNLTLLPTYYKYGTAVESAEAVPGRLGQTQTDIVIRPVRGRLLSISGLFNSPPDRPARLSLVTDTGRRLIASTGSPNFTSPFDASGIPPGPIELIAEGQDCGGYARLVLDKDTQGVRIGCTRLPRVYPDWRLDEGHSPVQFPLLARRVDLDGTGPAKELRPFDLLAPGHWEFLVQTAESHYVTNIRAQGSPASLERDNGWFGVDTGNPASIQIYLSSKPASVNGTVTTSGRPVTGAVVYLEAFNRDLPDPRLQLWVARSDVQGVYSFAGLRPGNYRVLSTFDFDPDDRYVMERAASFVLKEGDRAVQPVELILP